MQTPIPPTIPGDALFTDVESDFFYGTLVGNVIGELDATSLVSSTGLVSVNTSTPSTGQVLTATSATVATWQTPTSSAPGGLNTEVQYNNAGAFAGSSIFTFNPGTSTVTVAGTFSDNGGTTISGGAVSTHTVYSQTFNDTSGTVINGGTVAANVVNALTLTDGTMSTNGGVVTGATITAASNTVAANALKTLGASVNVASVGPPSAGQVLTASNATTAIWQTPTTTAPGAPVNSIQYNNAGAFGGSSLLTFSTGVVVDPNFPYGNLQGTVTIGPAPINSSSGPFGHICSQSATLGSGNYGQSLLVSSGNGDDSSTSGGRLILLTGTAAGQSGDLIALTGHNTSSGDTGNLLLSTGQTVNGRSGTVQIFTGSSNTGLVGTITIQGGNSLTTGDGGSVAISTGTAVTGNGGILTLSSGSSTGGAGAGGDVFLTTGTGSDSSGNIEMSTSSAPTTSGSITIGTGNVVNGGAGVVTITAGNSSAGISGGSVLISAGSGSADSAGGSMSLFSGGSATQTSGNVTIGVGNAPTLGVLSFHLGPVTLNWPNNLPSVGQVLTVVNVVGNVITLAWA